KRFTSTIGLARVKNRRPPCRHESQDPERTATRGAPQCEGRGGYLGGREDEDRPVIQRDQPPHRLDRRAAVGTQETVVADFLEAGGEDVLEEAAEKLHRVQRHP